VFDKTPNHHHSTSFGDNLLLEIRPEEPDKMMFAISFRFIFVMGLKQTLSEDNQVIVLKLTTTKISFHYTLFHIK